MKLLKKNYYCTKTGIKKIAMFEDDKGHYVITRLYFKIDGVYKGLCFSLEHAEAYYNRLKEQLEESQTEYLSKVRYLTVGKYYGE